MARKAQKPAAKKTQKQPQSKPVLTRPESQVPSSERSALKRAHILPLKKSVQHNEDDDESHTGIFDDRDECNDFEGDHARNSPRKNGRRADSKASDSVILITPTYVLNLQGLG